MVKTTTAVITLGILLSYHGPLRAIAPADKRRGRWVRQVIRVEVRDAP